MKAFFQILFGGLTAIVVGIGFPYLAGKSWLVMQNLNISIPAPKTLFASIENSLTTTVEGTSILGFRRTIRYNANEEEDLVNNALQILPKTDNGLITAKGYIVKNLSTGAVMANHNADTLMPIASLTKLVTAVVAKKLYSPSDHISITPQIINTYGNTGALRNGEVFRAEDLFYPLLMVSSNDAAEAFAQNYGRKKFIQAMNEWTQSIGAYRTYFDDPSGLSPANVSTASDLALILDYLRKNEPELVNITLSQNKQIGSHVWINPTHFLNWSNFKGGKNGYIPESDRTGAELFTLGPDRSLFAVVVLGSSFRDGDVLKLLGKAK